MRGGVFHYDLNMARKKTSVMEVIPPDSMAARYPDQDDVKDKQKLESYERRWKFIDIASQVAENNFYIMNWKWPGSDRLVPPHVSIDFKMISKYFPYAKGGPLLVDEPRFPDQVKLCFEKQRLLKHLKMRYVVIEIDSTYFDVLAQLEG